LQKNIYLTAGCSKSPVVMKGHISETPVNTGITILAKDASHPQFFARICYAKVINSMGMSAMEHLKDYFSVNNIVSPEIFCHVLPSLVLP
jgi:hypothetical protein